MFRPRLNAVTNIIVVTKYVPAVGDSKRAIDDYYSEIFCGGRSNINILNECEYRKLDSSAADTKFTALYPVLSLRSYMLKAPLVKPGTEVVNSLNRQRNAPETFLKAYIGLGGKYRLVVRDTYLVESRQMGIV
ncbi:hypothetical protein B0H17DRAFT_1133219 [Mycena rosella]|uniref:inositol-3-phosphate synthase n=1 Tax=Mycena rosella TaxID=1033263 RepID=A0AAD7DIQ5_MYCRO|nr:hypothetical protein B0H17DRAFT_1133219 [Mycena rosella]